MENTLSLQHMITKIRPNTTVALTSDGNTTLLSQFKMQFKIRPEIIVVEQVMGNTSSLLHLKMQQMIYKITTMK